MSSALRKLRRTGEGEHRVRPLRPRDVVPPQERMSDVLTDFAEPLTSSARTDEDVRKAIGIAILAWNLALQAEEQQEELLRQAVRDLGEAAGNDAETMEYFENLVRTLVIRKKALYPKNSRVILKYEITERGDDLHLLVTSSAPNP